MTLLPLLLAAVPAFALRPILTEDAWMAPQGGIELEGWFRHAQLPGDVTEERFVLTPVWRAHRMLELSADLPLASTEGGQGSTGPGDVVLNAKVALVRDYDAAPDMSMRVSYKTHTSGGPPLGTDGSDLSLVLAESMAFGPYTGHLMVGHTFHGEPGASGAYLMGAAVHRPVNRHWNAFVDFTAELSRSSVTRDVVVALLGASRPVSETATYDVSVQIGLQDGAPDYGLVLGATWWLGKKDPKRI